MTVTEIMILSETNIIEHMLRRIAIRRLLLSSLADSNESSTDPTSGLHATSRSNGRSGGATSSNLRSSSHPLWFNGPAAKIKRQEIMNMRDLGFIGLCSVSRTIIRCHLGARCRFAGPSATVLDWRRSRRLCDVLYRPASPELVHSGASTTKKATLLFQN